MSGDVLSQNEIDALLAALSTGEMNAEELKKEEKEKRVRTYDFKRALRFSKDQIRGITRIHESFARLLTTHFSAQLRTFVQINVVSVDQIPYEEFIRSVPKMTILNVYELSPLEGRIVVEINPNVAYVMLDRVLGGRGVSINKVESLTEIESSIMTGIFEKAFENLREAWSTVVEIDPILTEFEVNPQFLRMVSPNETVVVISFNIQIGNVSGMINICLPHVVLEPLIPKLSVQYWMQTNEKKRSPIETKELEKKLKKTELPLVSLLGETDISIQDFLQLDVGDVITLDQGIHDYMLLMVRDKPMFTVQPGLQNKKVAVQIIESIKGGTDYDE